MNACSSSEFIACFGLGIGVVGGGGGKGAEIVIITLMGGGDISSSLMRKSMLSMFMKMVIHPSIPMGMVDEDLLGDICF